MSIGDAKGGRALEGVRIIDLTWLQVGPQATRLLASFGAQVIRIEWRERKAIDFIRYSPPFAPDHARPDGGISQGVSHGHGIRGNFDRGAYFNNTNPGKYGITLNLNHPKGRDLLRRMVRDANAITENFSPGQMDKWNLGYEELRKINPRIIYMQTTGVGKAGVYKDYVSYGPTAQAFSGLTFLSGLPEPRPPAGWGYSYLDHSPGYFGAIMLMAAIRRQRETGAGCYIDMSQSETGLMLSGTSIVEHQITGKPTARYGNRMPFRDWSPHGAYRCDGDDNWIAISIQSDEQWRALIEEMGSPEWARHDQFASAAGRKQHEDALDEMLATFTSACERYDLMNRLQARGIAAGVVQKASDRFDRDPQLKARGYFVELPHSEIGTWPIEGFPAKLSRSPANVGGATGRAAPKLGEDNDFVYGKLVGLSADEMSSLAEEGVI
ncbi:MAG: CoA transferase [Candidatus Binatus sp.]|uniref:CaiB/BaiF CoA transferase family protein n=1 Tax=Candidatus Binatus sp. TaxID=2811406 RepID=UPI002716B62F|nr:CoA transferase [Candidatus Binatus sp.]MDO8432592.1 CoA transferase [Candidatus Binatus sp.]